MTTWTIDLSWPSPDLSPNARVHWAKRSSAAKAYRVEGWAAALQARVPRMAPGTPARVVATFFEPLPKRDRDMDNMLASIKPALDGVADAIGVGQRGDHAWEIRLVRGAGASRRGSVVLLIEADIDPARPATLGSASA